MSSGIRASSATTATTSAAVTSLRRPISDAHGGGVEPADRLVGQPQVALIACRQRRAPSRSPRRECGPSSCARSAGRSRARIERASSSVGSGIVTSAEAARQRFVFGDVLLVFALRGRADDAHLAAREHRLEDVGGVRRGAERRAGADHGVRFVDEQQVVRPLAHFAQHVLDAILEHAAQHRARDERVHLQIQHLAVAHLRGNRLRVELDPARERFGHRGLADARLADEHDRVGALAVAEDFDRSASARWSRPKTGGSLSWRASRFRLAANCRETAAARSACAAFVAQLDVADDGGSDGAMTASPSCRSGAARRLGPL